MKDARLADRFDLTKSHVLLSGTQALVRLLLEQQARDAARGLETAGLVTGYRGSPLGALDFQLQIAQPQLEAARILFQPALNEELAVTALWGSQMAGLHGEGKYDGVFGLWYGKGPGVDRSGDAFRHANMAGTDRRGGVLIAMGDDHTGESSTTLHQSDPALIDAFVPILAPSSVQDILDFGILGLAMSRLTGNWVGLKCVKETVESSSTAMTALERLQPVLPEVDSPDGGLNIRVWDTPVEREARLIDFRREAAQVFAAANALGRRVHGSPGARIGFVAAGKSWPDLLEALALLGLQSSEHERFGITTYKVGMTWPLELESLQHFVKDLDTVIVIEEKRKIIETQMKEAFYNADRRPVIIGHKDAAGRVLLTEKYELNPTQIARAIGPKLRQFGIPVPGLDRIISLVEAPEGEMPPDLLNRVPYFCAGCPHNSSTVIPDGSRAYAGIGCHYMVQWMDRDTLGFTHMGGEGGSWVGEAPFSNRGHIYQNV
ncbi:MAG: indolepyruvate ferredoxin oxidoreductase family protein, partial [Rhodobacteraceae bacterium]|nr:indolepyruvate ferredoxin oxidoreductase family protein [Paracoccaceae bacterium]